MTTKIITTRFLTLFVLGICIGASFASASEVVGTLSSDTTNTSQATGLVGGEVLSTNSISGTVSGGSGNGGGRSSNSSPSGSVLGAATVSGQSPSFPNAGMIFEETSPLKQTISFLLLLSAALALFVGIKKVTTIS
jgi:hypothetical protein